jgi:hypothetical protein
MQASGNHDLEDDMFTRTTSRRAMTIIAMAAASAMVLSACSSGDDESTSEATPTVSETVEEIIVDEPLDAAGLACAAYYDLDALTLRYAEGMVAAGEMTEAQVKREFRRLTTEMVDQGEIAVAEGEVDTKVVANAKRLQKRANAWKKKDTLGSLSRKEQRLVQTQMNRIEKNCVRAGFPLPEANIILRTDVATG